MVEKVFQSYLLKILPKEWRGFHLDLSRHMFTMSHIKKIVDVLSFYKINKLQLHLTDDQGWH